MRPSLSVIVPARNEEAAIGDCVADIIDALTARGISHEIVIVNDNSSDRTEVICRQLQVTHETVRVIDNLPPGGFGLAVSRGLAAATGEAVAIMMADASDDPADLVAGYERLQQGYDCVFGSRFSSGGQVVDYPLHKLVLNRLANWFISFLFAIPYNDVTNAFKIYRREVIAGVQPLLSHHFNLTVELPLKALVRGYSYSVIPMSWRNRKSGISKLRIQEMGSRYLFIVLYVWLEKHLSRGDYTRRLPERKTLDA